MTAANLLTMGAPHAMTAQANTPTFGTFQVDSATDGVTWIVQAPGAITITHLGFRYVARTGTPPVYIIGIETPDPATGFPDGTVLGGGTPASKTFTPPADGTWDGTWQWIALDNAYTTTRGQQIALTIRHSSGTVDASNRSSFTTVTGGDGVGQDITVHPYHATMNLGTWTKNTGYPVYGLRTAGSRYGFPVENYFATNTAGTNARRQAMAFTLPAGHGDTFKVAGVRGHMLCSSTIGQTFKIALWNATTELQAVTFDSDVLSSSPINPRLSQWLFDETTLSTLTFGTKYYIGIEVTSSSAVGVRGWQLDDAADLAAFPGGSAYHLATYDGSNWSDDQTVRPMMELMLEDITEPTAGGGGASPIGLGSPVIRAA